MTRRRTAGRVRMLFLILTLSLHAPEDTLTLGAPPECPQRPYCGQGLEKTYGLTLKT